MSENSKSYSSGAAKRFLDDRLARGFVSFSLAELVAETRLSLIAARHQLLRLGASVVRVSPRQPFLLIVTPEHRAFGAPPIASWLDDYMQWLGRPYYVALQSAAAIHGSSQQAVQETQVMTDLPRREICVGRIRIRFIMKSGIGQSITQHVAGAYAPLLVSTPETTAYDLVRYANKIGGIERMAETITPMLPAIRARELRKVLAAENEAATSRALRDVFSVLGAVSLSKIAAKAHG